MCVYVGGQGARATHFPSYNATQHANMYSGYNSEELLFKQEKEERIALYSLRRRHLLVDSTTRVILVKLLLNSGIRVNVVRKELLVDSTTGVKMVKKTPLVSKGRSQREGS